GSPTLLCGLLVSGLLVGGLLVSGLLVGRLLLCRLLAVGLLLVLLLVFGGVYRDGLALKGRITGARHVRQADAGREEHAHGDPGHSGQQVACPAAAEHLLGTSSTERRAQASRFTGLDQDHEDQEEAREDVNDGDGRFEKLQHECFLVGPAWAARRADNTEERLGLERGATN